MARIITEKLSHMKTKLIVFIIILMSCNNHNKYKNIIDYEGTWELYSLSTICFDDTLSISPSSDFSEKKIISNNKFTNICKHNNTNMKFSGDYVINKHKSTYTEYIKEDYKSPMIGDSIIYTSIIYLNTWKLITIRKTDSVDLKIVCVWHRIKNN